MELFHQIEIQVSGPKTLGISSFQLLKVPAPKTSWPRLLELEHIHMHTCSGGPLTFLETLVTVVLPKPGIKSS
jgi:hypothetical protein